ncbi:MAG: hypothetical protein JXA11_02345 [Phycisphaerae bacterium]|nr:hypothetical protein [Phycisphaerae bacterium]
MSLEKVQSGQPMRIKAQTFNSILDATRAHQERQQSGGRVQANDATLWVRLYHQNDGDVIVKAGITATLRIGKNILGWECRRACSSMHVSIALFSGTTSGVTCEESYETTHPWAPYNDPICGYEMKAIFAVEEWAAEGGFEYQ